MSCILHDQSGSLQNLYTAARSEGVKLQPLMSVFCGECGTHHAAITPDDIVVNRSAPPPEPDDFKPFKYVSKSYCRDCASYHEAGKCKAPDRAEVLGADVGRGYDNFNGSI